MTILTVGNNRDYYEVLTNKDVIEASLLKYSWFESDADFFNNLRKEESPIPASELISYGGTVAVTERGEKATENRVSVLQKFFKSAEDYRKKHKADYVLIQNLEFGVGRLSEVSGLVQLLLKKGK